MKKAFTCIFIINLLSFVLFWIVYPPMMASRGVPSSYKEIEQYVPNEKDLMRLECLVRKNPDRKITEIIDHSTEYDVVYMREKWMKRSVPVTYKIIITCLSVNVVVIVICCFLFFIRLIRK